VNAFRALKEANLEDVGHKEDRPMTAENLRHRYEEDPDAIVKLFTQVLCEFGYEGLSEETVRMACESVYNGKQPVGIIDMFVNGWLTKGMEYDQP